MRENGENRTGEVELEQRSLFETGGDADCGDAGRSSKKDLLPHKIADIVRSPSALYFRLLFRSIRSRNPIDDRFCFRKVGLRLGF